MGQRANLIVICDGSREIYYTHHRANTLDQDLFWGPQYALGFIRAQRPVRDGQLLDEIWAEGGAIMDMDRRYLMWFGGEDITCCVPLRRLHARLMGQLWPSWSLHWASEGVADVARYLGIAVDAVTAAQKYEQLQLDKLIPRDKHILSAATLIEGSHTFFFPLPLPVDFLVMGAGSKLLDRLRQLKDVARDEGTFEVAGGLVIDTGAMSLDLWKAGWFADAAERLAKQWPGWKTAWHEERFEIQLQRSDPQFRFSDQSNEQLLNSIRKTLLGAGDSKSGAETAFEVAKLMSGQRDVSSVQINPHSLYDAQLAIPLEIRTQLFYAAASAINM